MPRAESTTPRRSQKGKQGPAQVVSIARTASSARAQTTALVLKADSERSPKNPESTAHPADSEYFGPETQMELLGAFGGILARRDAAASTQSNGTSPMAGIQTPLKGSPATGASNSTDWLKQRNAAAEVRWQKPSDVTGGVVQSGNDSETVSETEDEREPPEIIPTARAPKASSVEILKTVNVETDSLVRSLQSFDLRLQNLQKHLGQYKLAREDEDRFAHSVGQKMSGAEKALNASRLAMLEMAQALQGNKE